jgi:putative redox protein
MGELSEEQKVRLLAIANQCPIHKTLSNPIHISTQLK